jgi:hypothetical protein
VILPGNGDWGTMNRMSKQGGRPRMWVVGVVALVVVAVFGGAAAAARDDREGEGAARQAKSIAKSTTTTDAAAAASAKGQGRGKKPRPGATTTTTSTTTTTTLPPYAPGSDVKIPLNGFRFGDLLIDEARQRIYITGGTGTSDLIVTDLEGDNLRTLQGIVPGGAGMELSPDGSKLYVAASDSDGITVVDLATFQTSWQWTGNSDGTKTCPYDITFAVGQLWFSWGCDNAPAGIGRVDLETGAHSLMVTEGDGNIRSLLGSPARLGTVPGQPNIVIAAETDSSPAPLYRFEATSTRLIMRAQTWAKGGFAYDLEFTPDGSGMIIPTGSPYYHAVYSTTDLTEVGRYQTDPYPNAVAIRDDGLVVAGINGSYEKDVWVFEPGGSTPIATYEFGHLPDQYTWAHTLVNSGLAVHGNRIYAITRQSAEPYLTLRIRELP